MMREHTYGHPHFYKHTRSLRVDGRHTDGHLFQYIDQNAHGIKRCEHGNVIFNSAPPVSYTHLDVYKRQPLSRTNIWREMKGLCQEAGVNPQKVFPHNVRHLFARVVYGIEKDIAKLADILGHSSINTTRIYIISTGSEHRKRMENMHLIL